MKIIEPIQDLKTISTSNAPSDSIETWAPIGRDLLNYIEKPIFDIAGRAMIVASSEAAGPVYSVDLISGEVTDTGYRSGGEVAAIKISPNSNYAAVLINYTQEFRQGIDAIDIGSGIVRYSVSDGFIFSKSYPDSPIFFSSDSSLLYLGFRAELIAINTSTWSEINKTNMSGAFFSIAASDSNVFINHGLVSDFLLTKTDLSGNEVASSESVFMTSIIYDESLDKLIAMTEAGELMILNPLTLAVEVTPPSVSGSFYPGPQSIKIFGSHLILRSLSSSPYWNFYLLTDYSLDKSLPALPDPGEGIALMSDSGESYSVVQQNSGIAIIDNVDNSILQQSNPSVIAGDKYVYIDKIYEVLIDNNQQPDEGTLTEPATWLDAGYINQLKMFDGKIDSATESDTDLEIEISPNQLTGGLAIFNLTAAAVRVRAETTEVIFDSGEISLIDNSGVNDWFQFFFSEYDQRTNFISLDIPPYPEAKIIIDIIGNGSPVSVGEIVLGKISKIGDSQFGTGVGIIDFSQKEVDSFGNFTILKRRFSKRADYDVKIPTNNVGSVQRKLAKYRAEPVVWIADQNREETIIYGYYRSFDIVLSNPSLSDTAITVEGL